MRRLLQSLVENLIVVLFGGFVLLVFAEVVARYVFNWPLIWSAELAKFLFVWVIMLGTAIGVYRGAHLGFDLILNLLPLKAQTYLSIVNRIVMLVFVSIIIVKGFELSIAARYTLSPAMEIPMILPYLALPVSGILMGIYLLHSIYLAVVEVRKEYPHVPEEKSGDATDVEAGKERGY
jgi:TRAP-type C4-dicarboxylate transport system permease small subunit